MTIEQASRVHANPDVIFIDVRTAKSWWRSTTKIARAIREKPGAIEHWDRKYGKDKTLILYCA